MKRFLLISFILLTLFQSSFADCVACWELKYVKITTKDSKIMYGYIKWNKAWFVNIWNENIKIPESFPDDFDQYYSIYENGHAEIYFYKNINYIKLDENCILYYAFKSDFQYINYSNILLIEKVENELDNISGADELSIVELKYKEILKHKPINYKMLEADLCEYYFLNYDLNMSFEKLNKLITYDNFEDKEILEDNSIIVLHRCWD